MNSRMLCSPHQQLNYSPTTHKTHRAGFSTPTLGWQTCIMELMRSRAIKWVEREVAAGIKARAVSNWRTDDCPSPGTAQQSPSPFIKSLNCNTNCTPTAQSTRRRERRTKSVNVRPLSDSRSSYLSALCDCCSFASRDVYCSCWKNLLFPNSFSCSGDDATFFQALATVTMLRRRWK